MSVFIRRVCVLCAPLYIFNCGTWAHHTQTAQRTPAGQHTYTHTQTITEALVDLHLIYWSRKKFAVNWKHGWLYKNDPSAPRTDSQMNTTH